MQKENIVKLQNLLEHDNQDTRQQLRELFKDHLFTPRYNVSLDEERDLALRRQQKICDHQICKILQEYIDKLTFYGYNDFLQSYL